jgi:hypothetical protein
MATKKSVKKPLLTSVEALSRGLPPRFRGARTVSVQIASRVANEVENGRGGRRSTGRAASQERRSGLE